jgi:hypothetical protein
LPDDKLKNLSLNRKPKKISLSAQNREMYLPNNLILMQALILNSEKLNTQVTLRTAKQSDGSYKFTLNNYTKNTYRVFLECCFNIESGLPVYKKTSYEFLLPPGVTILHETEIGKIIPEVKEINELLSGKYSLCVKQKFGPDLGFNYIEL